MMRPGQVLALVAAGIALAGVGAWLVARRASEGTPDAPTRVLPLKQDQLNTVTRLRIFKGDGSHATLTRDGAGWIVTERGYAADTGQVRKLLLDLASLSIEEQKTADPALYARLGVEDPNGAPATSTGVDIDSGGKTLQLIVGKTSGTGSVYVRVPRGGPSMLATPQLAPDADPRHWLDRALLDIAPDQITQVDVQPAGAPGYLIKRGAADAESDFVVSPIPKGRELQDPTAPSAQAAGLAGLQFDDVRKAGATAATAHATFRCSDGLSIAIAGIAQGETRYIAIAATATTPATQARAQELNARLAAWEFELPGYRYDGLFRPLEQMLVPKAAASSAPSRSPVTPGSLPNGLPVGPQGSKIGHEKATPQLSH